MTAAAVAGSSHLTTSAKRHLREAGETARNRIRVRLEGPGVAVTAGGELCGRRRIKLRTDPLGAGQPAASFALAFWLYSCKTAAVLTVRKPFSNSLALLKFQKAAIV